MTRNHLLYLLLLACIFTDASYAGESPPSPYISKGACPFEGCRYGDWKVLKPTKVHSKPDLQSTVLTDLKPGDIAKTVTGEVHVIPGIAKMIGEPYKNVVEFDPVEPIYILDYIGEGYSRIHHKGQYFTTKIARKKIKCKEHNDDWRNCWVEVLKEPVSVWWAVIQLPSKEGEGWVLVEDNLQVIDDFSWLLPPIIDIPLNVISPG